MASCQGRVFPGTVRRVSMDSIQVRTATFNGPRIIHVHRLTMCAPRSAKGVVQRISREFRHAQPTSRAEFPFCRCSIDARMQLAVLKIECCGLVQIVSISN
jgi:hypothetical protein